MAEAIATTIKQLWPDFNVTVDLIKEPTTDFVCGFYERFCDEIDKTIGDLTNTKPVDPTNESSKSRRIILLHAKVHNIYNNYIKFSNITINDFYRPTSKRIIVLFRVAVHFIIFIDHTVEPLSQVMARPLEAVKELNYLRDELPNLQQQNEELSQTLGGVRSQFENLQIKLEQLNKLKTIKQQEAALSKLIINENDLNDLQTFRDQLHGSLDDLDRKSNEFDRTLLEKKRMVDNSKEMLRLLNKLNFDKLPINNWKDIIDDIQTKREYMDQQITSKRELIDQKARLVHELDELSKEYQRRNTNYDNKYKSWNSKLQQLQNDYQSLIVETNRKAELKNVIDGLANNIDELMENKEELKRMSESYWNELAIRERNVLSNFEERLAKIRDDLNNP